jgi:hypothetical protein
MLIMSSAGLTNRALAEVHGWPTPEVRATAAVKADHAMLERLEAGLKQTPVIGFFDKISLKGQLDALIDGVRRYHKGEAGISRDDLAHQFKRLFRRTLDLLEADRSGLYQEIAASRGALWNLMIDRRTFTKLSSSNESAFPQVRDNP